MTTLSYDTLTDIITINGQKYLAALFGPEGFGAPEDTLLRIVKRADGVVTVARNDAEFEGRFYRESKAFFCKGCAFELPGSRCNEAARLAMAERFGADCGARNVIYLKVE